MIAYIIGTCAKGIVYYRTRSGVKIYPRSSSLFEQHACAADFLAAERTQEVRHQPVHQLEVRRQRRRVLLRVVKDLLAVALRVHRRAGSAVDEDELRPQDKAFALHVLAHGAHDPPAETVVRLLIALHEPRRRSA